MLYPRFSLKNHRKMSLIILIQVTNPYPGLTLGDCKVPWLAYIMSCVWDEKNRILMKMKAGIQTTWIESQKMCLFSPTAITKYCRMAGLNNRNLLSHSSGGWKSEIRVSATLISSEGCERGSVTYLSSSFWALLAIFHVPCLVDTQPWYLPLSSHGILLVFLFPKFLLL